MLGVELPQCWHRSGGVPTKTVLAVTAPPTFGRKLVRPRHESDIAWHLGAAAMSAHAISDHVIRTARAALSTAARNARGLKSTAYSALLASLLYEQLDKELRCVQAEDVHKQNILAKAIDCCRQAAGSSVGDAVNVRRAVLELLETGVPPQVNATPQERRA